MLVTVITDMTESAALGELTGSRVVLLHTQLQRHALATCLRGEGSDDPGTDAAALVGWAQLDPGELDQLFGAYDAEPAHRHAVDLDNAH